MKKISLLSLMILFSINLFGQILKPVKWSYAAKRTNDKEAIVFIKATIDNGWHIYSINQKDGGPIKTTFDFEISKDYTLIGKLTEPAPLSRFEKTFGIDVHYFEKEVVFQQKVKLISGQATIKGKVNFMACNDHKCLSPDNQEFSITIK
jgi:endo-1,4-beta-D-glucanase Y